MTIPYQSGKDSTVAQLLDTNINSNTLANGDTLVYNSTTGEWENGAGGGGGVTLDYLQQNYYDLNYIDASFDANDLSIASKIPTSRLGPSGQSPSIVDRTDTTSNVLVTEQSLLNWVGGQLTEGGASYQIVQPKLYITDTTNTKEINAVDANGDNVVEFIKARVNSAKDGGFDGTDDRRLTTNLAINNHLVANYLPVGGSSSANLNVDHITAVHATITNPLLDRVVLRANNYNADPVREFTRLKTNYHQILSTDAVSQSDPNGVNSNQPISCQALLDAGANAHFTNAYGTGQHLLPPSGASIKAHLEANYQRLGSSTGSSSSLTIDTQANATSTATRTAQTVGTGIFYQNGTQLRVQYKSTSSNYQDVLIGAFDTTSPVITITGENPASVTVGTTYTDAGATANDGVDGDVTSSITTTINVDTSTVGTNYSVTYSVEDGAGNLATAIRAVHVVAVAGPSWTMVRRRAPGTNKWHRATSNLAGTDVYGSGTESSGTWSVHFENTVPGYNYLMFAWLDSNGTGPKSTKWLIAPKTSIGNWATTGEETRAVHSSSLNSSAHSISWHTNINGGHQHPYIALTNWSDQPYSNNMIVYGEASDYVSVGASLLHDSEGAGVWAINYTGTNLTPF